MNVNPLQVQKARAWLICHQSPLNGSKSLRMCCSNGFKHNPDRFSKGMRWYVDALKELSYIGMDEDDLINAYPGRKVEDMTLEEVGAIMV